MDSMSLLTLTLGRRQPMRRAHCPVIRCTRVQGYAVGLRRASRLTLGRDRFDAARWGIVRAVVQAAPCRATRWPGRNA